MNDKDFIFYLTKYFSDFLPNHTGYSYNTISSYKNTFLIFIDYATNVRKIKFDNLKFDIINSTYIREFLLWLQNERNSSACTRNQRLAAIKSFFKYVQVETPNFLTTCLDVQSIKKIKVPTKDMKYLTTEEVKMLMDLPSWNKKNELRDLALLSLMYDSGARVQEIVDLKVSNLKLGKLPTITLIGKGNKARTNPINKNVSKIIIQYIKIYNLNSEDYLFNNINNNKLTRYGVSYILNKYFKILKNKQSDITIEKLSPHMLRHSKAMHLLEAGVNLIYIRDFLGHISVTTTEIYAKVNPEIRRKQLEKVNKNVIKNGKYSEQKKNELIKLLKNEL